MSRQRLVNTKGSFVATENLMSRQSLLELCSDRVFSRCDKEGWVCTTGKAGRARQAWLGEHDRHGWARTTGRVGRAR